MAPNSHLRLRLRLRLGLVSSSIEGGVHLRGVMRS